MNRCKFIVVVVLVFLTNASIAVAQQDTSSDRLPERDSSERTKLLEQDGPLKDVTFQIRWLIESDDMNRKPYEGPARNGLADAGFGRLVNAGSLTSSVTIGQKSVVTGGSRYGLFTTSLSMLNTTDNNALQVKIDLQSKSKTPIVIDTTVRIPLNRWVLIGAADSRVGLPVHETDGRRGVMIMRVIDGVQLLD